MGVLLDTHIAVWAIAQSSKLYQTERELIRRSTGHIYVSVVTLCEIAVNAKQSRAAFDPFPFSVEEGIKLFAAANFTILPVLPPHAAQMELLPVLHKDPFDRLLISQSKAENLVFVSRDRILQAYFKH